MSALACGIPRQRDSIAARSLPARDRGRRGHLDPRVARRLEAPPRTLAPDLDHADAIAENAGVLALLGDMLAARPAERVLLLSSRVRAAARFARYLAPHQVLTLSRDELQLDNDEAAGVFEGTDLAPDRRQHPSACRRLADRAASWRSSRTTKRISTRLLDRLARPPAPTARISAQRGAVRVYARHDVDDAWRQQPFRTRRSKISRPRRGSAMRPRSSTGCCASPDLSRRKPGRIKRIRCCSAPCARATGRDRHRSTCFGPRRAYERSGDFLRAAELYSYRRRAAAGRALDRLPAAAFEPPSLD